MSSPIRQQTDPEFATTMDAIGNGASPTVNIPFIQQATSAEQLIDFVFPDSILNNPIECNLCSILAPLNQQINTYNELILQ